MLDCASLRNEPRRQILLPLFVFLKRRKIIVDPCIIFTAGVLVSLQALGIPFWVEITLVYVTDQHSTCTFFVVVRSTK
jgi:hypothetical protein